MDEKIQQIQKDYLDKIKNASSLKELDEIFLGLFGKSGNITLLPKEFGKLSTEEKKKIGPLFNKVKQKLEDGIEKRRNEIREQSYKALYQEKFTFTPERWEAKIKKRQGHLHPLTQFEKKITDLFGKLEFQQFEAPHIDTDYNVYEVLNIPKDSPARDLQDTFYLSVPNGKASSVYSKRSSYIDTSNQNLILRGHTSNSEVSFMKTHTKPIRMMSIGRCFRVENLDNRHEHTFDQFEIVYIDKGVNMGNLQYLSEYFLKSVFGSEIKARLRTKFYPQVEPGAGVDGLCMFCKGKGCRICGNVGWLELGGAGMIHPVVLKNGDIDTDEYSGLAWGISPERMVMLIEGIEDIRLFRNGDLRFLEKY